MTGRVLRFFAALRMTGRMFRMTGRKRGPEGHDKPREGPEGFAHMLSKLLIINSFLPPPREPGERIGNGAICGYSGHSEQFKFANIRIFRQSAKSGIKVLPR